MCERIRNGDSAAFTELIRRNKRALDFLLVEFDWALMYLPRDDQLQEALIGFWKAAVDYEPRQDATYATMAKTYARARVRTEIARARTVKAMMIRDAMSLDAEVTDSEGLIGTLGDTVAGPEWLDPEIIAEIRADLRMLSAELPGKLSSVEHEALGRVMLDEQMGGRQPDALERVRRKASDLLGYRWRGGDNITAETRKIEAFQMLDAGHDVRTVARKVRVPPPTVMAWVKQRRTGQLEETT